LRLSGVAVDDVDSTTAWACGQRIGDGSGGRNGVSPTLENGRIPRVLVDNKSAAEIGEKGLLLVGKRRLGATASAAVLQRCGSDEK
jgi:hypothetical protein